MAKTDQIRYETLRIGETLILDGEEWLITNISLIASRAVLRLMQVTENNNGDKHEKIS